MGKLSNFFNLFKRNSLSENNNINDKSILNEHENVEFNLKDNDYNLNQIDINENINAPKELKISNYALNNTFSNESDFLKLFKYDSIADSSKTFNIETALNNNWDKVDNFAKDVSQEMEHKADKIYKGNLPVTDILDIPFNINNSRYQITTIIPNNSPAEGRAWSTIETKPCSSVRYLDLHWINWGYAPIGKMFSAILDTENKVLISPWKEVATTDKVDILSGNLKNGYGFAGGSNTITRNGNSVTINTILSVGTITNNTTIMTMPTGCIPLLTQSFTCLWYSDPVTFQVGKLSVLPTTGDMVIFGMPSTKHSFVLISATFNL